MNSIFRSNSLFRGGKFWKKLDPHQSIDPEIILHTGSLVECKGKERFLERHDYILTKSSFYIVVENEDLVYKECELI